MQCIAGSLTCLVHCFPALVIPLHCVVFFPEDVAGEGGTEAERGLLEVTLSVGREGPVTADNGGFDAALGGTIGSERGRGGTVTKGGARVGFVGVSDRTDLRAYCIVKDCLPS